jgi:integrase
MVRRQRVETVTDSRKTATARHCCTIRACGNLPAHVRTQNPAPVAYIRKYRDGWRAEVQRNGQRASFAATTKREVQQWALRMEAEIDGTKASKGTTFAQAAAKYVLTVSRDKAAGAAEWESRRFEEMGVFFGDETKLASITSERVGAWRDWRLQQVSASTVLRDRSLLQNLFQVAADEWKILSSNPFKGVRFPTHNPPRHQVWTWPLIKRVLRAQNRNPREVECIRAFHIALHTGMRLSEILAAKVEGNIAVLARDKTSGKASAPVKVPLARKGAELFAKYLPFTIAADIASATFSDLTDELLIDGLTFHDSRASALTWLSRRYDVMTLARISRHKNLRTLMDSYYRESAEQIAARL